jgi:bifunctional DNA-binding transcriptional regulator/antitoxin component of YhaV-PrlF toxin-antitoxin module
MEATIDDAGRLVIPEEIRRLANFGRGVHPTPVWQELWKLG